MTQHNLCATIPDSAIVLAQTHLAAILELAIEHQPEQEALLIGDRGCDLALALGEAYRRCLPTATFLDFDRTTPQAVLAAFQRLVAGDLVVLIQSTNFRLNAFRIRVGLFKRGIKVIEHPHLGRMRDGEGQIYIDALAYDPDYFRGVGRALQARLAGAQTGLLESGESLVFPAGFEPAKLNVGDYREMRNVGGQYPIGEVFSESADLEAVHGRVRIFAFGDRSYGVNVPKQPITLVVEQGRVSATLDSTQEFDEVLAAIRADEGQVWLRELGFGLNRALTPERVVSDIGTFERMCGVHLSLGAKHLTYNKPVIRKRAARHHVDIFPITQAMGLDGHVLFSEGAWKC